MTTSLAPPFPPVTVLCAALALGVAAIACGPAATTPVTTASPPSVGGPASDDPVADLVILGGRILTLEEDRPEVEALAARDGHIVALGTRDGIEPLIGPATEVVELAPGEVAIPGFVEGHGHFLGLGDMTLQLDLRGAASWTEIVAEVARAAAEAAPGEWIRGRGWHQDKWQVPPSPAVEGFPLHDALSAVSPDNPVFLVHASGHAVFVNARALELAGIDGSTADPAGGEILRDEAGRATGLLREYASDLVAEVMTAGGVDHDRRRIHLASEAALAHGVTSFHDAGSTFEQIDRLRAAAEDGTLGVRLWVMVREPNERLAEHLADYAGLRAGDGMLTVGGIKVTLDGALGSRGAWLLEPYADSPGAVGLPTVTLESLRETAALARRHDLQLAVHAIGDRANREVLDVYATNLAAAPAGDLRWRVEHAQHLHPADLHRFAELGVIASMQAVHATSDGPWVPDRLGEERTASGAYRWRDLLDSGAVVINGTDTPVEPIDPIANFHAAVTRRMDDGRAFHPEQRMTREEALAAATRDAAWAAFQEDEVGTLAEGKRSDVVVLSQDLLTVPDERLPETEVVATILGGAVVYRGGDGP